MEVYSFVDSMNMRAVVLTIVSVLVVAVDEENTGIRMANVAIPKRTKSSDMSDWIPCSLPCDLRK